MNYSFSRSSVAIVANGPSGTDQGASIDRCDFVIRMNAWITEGPKNAGSKISALCGFCDGNHIVSKGKTNGVEVPDWLKKRRDWELWCPIAAEGFLAEPTRENVGDWRWLLRTADGRPIRLNREITAQKVITYLKTLSNRFKYPSLGMACLSLVMDLTPKELHIWGYDSTKAGLPTYNLAQVELNWDCLWHDFVAEKRIIAELADKKLWLGKPSTVKLVWHNRPKECPVLT